jgi:hypothetical protein
MASTFTEILTLSMEMCILRRTINELSSSESGLTQAQFMKIRVESNSLNVSS